MKLYNFKELSLEVGFKMASVVVANDAASFNREGRVAICELDMPLSWRHHPMEFQLKFRAF